MHAKTKGVPKLALIFKNKSFEVNQTVFGTDNASELFVTPDSFDTAQTELSGIATVKDVGTQKKPKHKYRESGDRGVGDRRHFF